MRVKVHEKCGYVRTVLFKNSTSKFKDKISSRCGRKFGVYLGVKTCEVFLCFVTIMFALCIVLTSLFSLFYVTREGDRFLHRG